MTTLVRDIMTRRPVTITARRRLLEARRLLRLFHIRHLPVVHGETVVGMVSGRDVLMRDRELVQALDRLHSVFVDGRYRRVGDAMTSPVVTVEAGPPRLRPRPCCAGAASPRSRSSRRVGWSGSHHHRPAGAVVDQASARTALLDAYAAWAPDADIEITGTMTAAAGLQAVDQTDRKTVDAP